MVEIMIYAFILVVLVSVIMTLMIALTRSYRTLQSSTSVQSSAAGALERMTRSIRGGTSIDTGNSTLGSSPGKLVLNTLDIDGNATTVQFYLSGQQLRVKEGGVEMGPLTATSTKVTNLVFRRIITSQSEAVKVEMTLESGTSTSYRSKKFYSTIVVRGTYPVQ